MLQIRAPNREKATNQKREKNLIVSTEEYEKCECCGNTKTIAEEKFVCDACKKTIRPGSMLDLFHYDEYLSAREYNFCSWSCLAGYMPNAGLRNGFVVLPDLNYDEEREGLRAEDFWKEIR